MKQFNITNRDRQAFQFDRNRELTKCISILFLFSFTSIFSLVRNDLQTKAEKAYSSKNYKQSIECYESILKEGLTSYKLHYNLGNAYFKNNELGKAIYHYELANKIQPNNNDVKTNLKIANDKTIDKIESKENFFIIAIKSRLVNLLSSNGWAWLSIFSLVSCLVFTFLFFINNQINLKRIVFISSAISFTLFLASMIIGFSSIENKQEINFAIVINRESNVHEEPSATSKTKFSLHEGTKVSVLEKNTEWTNIKLENGNEGWINTSELGLL